MIPLRQVDLRKRGCLPRRGDHERIGALMRQHDESLRADDDAALLRHAIAQTFAERIRRLLAAVVPPHVDTPIGGVRRPGIRDPALRLRRPIFGSWLRSERRDRRRGREAQRAVGRAVDMAAHVAERARTERDAPAPLARVIDAALERPRRGNADPFIPRKRSRHGIGACRQAAHRRPSSCARRCAPP